MKAFVGRFSCLSQIPFPSGVKATKRQTSPALLVIMTHPLELRTMSRAPTAGPALTNYSTVLAKAGQEKANEVQYNFPMSRHRPCAHKLQFQPKLIQKKPLELSTMSRAPSHRPCAHKLQFQPKLIQTKHWSRV
jgi:hypothetical protein